MQKPVTHTTATDDFYKDSVKLQIRQRTLRHESGQPEVVTQGLKAGWGGGTVVQVKLPPPRQHPFSESPLLHSPSSSLIMAWESCGRRLKCLGS